MEENIVNGEFLRATRSDDKHLIHHVGQDGKEHEYLANLQLQDEVDYTGLFLQVAIETSEMSYIRTEWFSSNKLP